MSTREEAVFHVEKEREGKDQLTLAGKALRILFYFHGFLLLALLLYRLEERVIAGAVIWLPYVLLCTVMAALLWVLYQESRLPPAGPAPIAVHMIWLLSAWSYIWLGDDPGIRFVGHVWPDFSEASARMFEEALLRQLIWTSIYILLSTTGLAWLTRVVARRGGDSSEAQTHSRIDVLLRISIAAMLVALVLRWINPSGSIERTAYVIAFSFLLALLLAAIGVSRGNKMAFGVGVAEILSVQLVSTIRNSLLQG